MEDEFNSGDKYLVKLFDTVAFVWKKITVHKTQVILLLTFGILLATMIWSKLKPPVFVSKELGYAVTGPSYKWEMFPSEDLRSVSFKKYKNKPLRNAEIKVKYELGNPYGKTSLDYIVAGMIPRIQYTYDIPGQHKLTFRDVPAMQWRKGIEWASISFVVDYASLQILYVTVVHNNIIMVALNSTDNHGKDEDVFYDVVDSFKAFDVPQIVNIFKTETKSQNVEKTSDYFSELP